MSLFPCSSSPSTDAERRLWEVRRAAEVTATQAREIKKRLADLEGDEAKQAAENLGLDLDALKACAKSIAEIPFFAPQTQTAATPKPESRSPLRLRGAAKAAKPDK